MKTVFIRTNLVSIGQNPEMADIENPRGDIIGYSAVVIVEKRNGAREEHQHPFVHRIETEAIAMATPLRDKVQSHLDAGGKLNEMMWDDIQPCYGSQAYIDGGWERIAAQLDREEF